MCAFIYLVLVWIQTHLRLCWRLCFCVDPVHCSWDPQVQISTNFSLKLGSTTLFTHLKIILLQCFQFSAINGIQLDPYFKCSLKTKQNKTKQNKIPFFFISFSSFYLKSGPKNKIHFPRYSFPNSYSHSFLLLFLSEPIPKNYCWKPKYLFTRAYLILAKM